MPLVKRTNEQTKQPLLEHDTCRQEKKTLVLRHDSESESRAFRASIYNGLTVKLNQLGIKNPSVEEEVTIRVQPLKPLLAIPSKVPSTIPYLRLRPESVP